MCIACQENFLKKGDLGMGRYIDFFDNLPHGAWCFIISTILSLLISVIFFVRFFSRKKHITEQRSLKPIQELTIGIFVAVLLVFVPVYYLNFDFGDDYNFIRPALLSLHNTLRVFILDGEFNVIVDAVRSVFNGAYKYITVTYSLYVALLYIVAPVLTFGNVWMLFDNLRGKLKFNSMKFRKIYIMSELNEKSLALAKSIYCKTQNLKGKEKPAIVFTDVFLEKEEVQYDMAESAREIGAILLKQDINNIDILSKKGNIELFLISENESNNLSQAVKITNLLNQENKKRNVKIFVFSNSRAGACIIDSVRYENLIDSQYNDSSFKLRRVDEIRQFVWNAVPKMNIFELAQKADKELHVLLVGMGRYGMEFLKMLTWFSQVIGYKIVISVVDRQTYDENGKHHIHALINSHCPELIDKNNSTDFGDAQYDIEIISGIDMISSDFRDLLVYTGSDENKAKLSQRLRKTDLAIVALGDDDLNIEVSVKLRELYDYANSTVANKKIKEDDELVKIYSIVYDENKSGALLDRDEQTPGNNFLVNHKNIPYHINFIGALSSQFSYENVYDSELEQAALRHHLGWVEIEKKVYDEWKDNGELKKIAESSWGYMYCESEEAVEEMKKDYERFEYFRHSSISKEIYQRAVKANPQLSELTSCTLGGDIQTCTCEHCITRKMSEHMRWNAYMRCAGYSHVNTMLRADRAKIHNNICGWDRLSDLDKEKD